MVADRDETSVSAPESDVEAMIDELAAASARLAELHRDSAALQRDSAAMLEQLLAERSRIRDSASNDPQPAESGPLGDVVRDIATLFAQAAGLSVEEFLREAVFAYGAQLTGDGHGTRAGKARDEALRVRRESLAVKAQHAQAAARAAKVAGRVEAAQQSGKPNSNQAAKAPRRRAG